MANALTRMSIGKKLFLLITVLLLVAVGGLSVALFQTTHRAALAVATERLDGVTRDLAGMLTNNLPRTLDSTSRLGRLPEVVAAFRAPPGAPLVVPDTLRRLSTGRQVAAIALRDTGLARRAIVGRAAPPFAIAPARALAASARNGRGIAIGGLLVAHDSVFYPTMIVVGPREAPVGYVVIWRQVNSTPQVAGQLRALVGAGAGLFIGNRTGDVWTDLSGPVSGPPAAAITHEGLYEYERAGVGRMLVRTRSLAGTPWVVAIEFPRAVVLARVRSFLWAELMIATLLIVIGGVAAWAMSRRITGPIGTLTQAAESLAGGNLATRVPLSGDGELGRLASAFNGMADRVQQSHLELQSAAEQLRGLNAELEVRVARRTQELQAANNELEAFSYSVSHDLRAPLRAIDGFSRLVLEDHAREVGAEGRRLLDVIRANTRRMGNLIDDLLSFSKLGRQKLTKGPVDLTAVVHEVVNEVRGSEPDHPVDVEVRPLGSSWGDRSLLRHVFQNLVQNALKFSRTKDRSRIEIGTQPGLGERVFFVRDNGVGFDPRYADKLFGVFQRLHRVEEFEGTGVGLAIVARIVHRHGGRVWAEGTPGGGATFYFTLPNEEAVA